MEGHADLHRRAQHNENHLLRRPAILDAPGAVIATSNKRDSLDVISPEEEPSLVVEPAVVREERSHGREHAQHFETVDPGV
ncbi:hypothetical protein LJR013_003586 [Pseudarthrobacter oxydans]|jgi:hypothetical protein|uniref:hypothetical protein n=1 Tax=Pseudarthrobacter oxydans TaxID=1671 RepID=UPI003ECE7DEB